MQSITFGRKRKIPAMNQSLCLEILNFPREMKGGCRKKILDRPAEPFPWNSFFLNRRLPRPRSKKNICMHNLFFFSESNHSGGGKKKGSFRRTQWRPVSGPSSSAAFSSFSSRARASSPEGATLCEGPPIELIGKLDKFQVRSLDIAVPDLDGRLPGWSWQGI